MKTALVDANVILRLFTNDPPEMAEQAQRLFARVDAGEIILFVPDLVVAEVVWVMQSFYHYPTADISSLLQDFLSHPGLVCEDKSRLLVALSLFASKNIDLIDALVSVQMNHLGISEIYSFDSHFNRLPGISRLAPGD